MLNFFIITLKNIAWMYILLPSVLFGGFYFTLKNKGIQFSKLGFTLKNTVGKVFRTQNSDNGSVTPFQSVTTALSATLGTGNIIGTAQAISIGGYGAIFWLWIAALFGMIIKYSEVTLSIKYRIKNEKGEWVGGPMYYIVNGLGKRYEWLAVAFSVCCVFSSFGIGNLAQCASISGAVCNALFEFFPQTQNHDSTIRFLIGIVLAVVLFTVLTGGIKRIGKLTEILIPFLSIIYIVFTLIVIITNKNSLFSAFRKIIVGAFKPSAVSGAACSIAFKQTVLMGLKRSAFSNEAGLGSSAIAHASANTKEPAEQGLFGIFEVFVDTIIVCTLTALTIIVSGVKIEFGKLAGSELITNAFSTVFGIKFASIFIVFTLILLAFSTLVGWSLYGRRSMEFLFGIHSANVYNIIFILFTLLGSTVSLELVWDISDTFNGLMAIPNFIALFVLSGKVAKETEKYFKKL